MDARGGPGGPPNTKKALKHLWFKQDKDILKDLLLLNNQNKVDGAAGGVLRKLSHFARKASANLV